MQYDDVITNTRWRTAAMLKIVFRRLAICVILVINELMKTANINRKLHTVYLH